MHIFERLNDDKIKIYTLEADEKKVLYFKENYLVGSTEKVIPEYKAITNVKEDILKYNEERNLWNNPIPKKMDSNDFIFQQGLFGRKYHILEEDHFARHFYYRSYLESVESNAQILDVLFTSNVDKKFTFDKHFLLLQNHYKPDKKYSEIRNMEGIIEIPYPMYLLELIMQGHFSHLPNNIDLSSLINLFNISPFQDHETISLGNLKALEELGFVENGCEKVLAQANECEKILKYIKNT